jgi:hypothetical protein
MLAGGAPRMALLSVLLYAAALAAPAFAGRAGAAVLVHGWREMLFARAAGPLVAFAWLANPLLLASLLCACLRAWRIASALAVAALALGLAVSFGSHIIIEDEGPPLPMPHLGAGYWLWVSSLAAALIAAILGTRAATQCKYTGPLSAAQD